MGLRPHGSRHPTQTGPRRASSATGSSSTAWSWRTNAPSASCASASRHGDDPVKTVRDAVEIGARVLDREQAGANAEFVKTEFERASRERRAASSPTRRARSPSSSSTQVDEVFGPENGQLAKELEKLFGDGSSVVGAEPRARAGGRDAHAARARTWCASSRPPTARNPLADFKARRAARRSTQAASRSRRHAAGAARRSSASSRRSSRRCATRRTSSRRSRPSASAAPPRGAPSRRPSPRRSTRIAAAQGDVRRGGRRPCRGHRQGGRRGRGHRRLQRPGARAHRVRGQGPPAVEARRRWRSSTRRWPSATPTSPCWSCPTEDELPAKLEPLREYNGDKLLVALDPDDAARSRSSSATGWRAPAC